MKSYQKKSLLLGGIILIPAIVFIMLKLLGENRFDIPVYYVEGVADTLNTDCGRSKDAPYKVFTRPASQVVHKIYHFEPEVTDELGDRLEELERVQEAFREEKDILMFSFLNSPKITRSAVDVYNDRVNINPGFWSIRPVDSLSYTIFKNCELVMNDVDDRVVLVDKEEQIRGYYDISDREETDRLILELKILLSQEK